MTVFSDGFVETPYWWEAAAPEEGRPHSELRDVDFLVIGAGLTGLNAAITLAGAGCDVAVVDARLIGEAASTRNGGQIRAESKVATGELSRRFGEDVARGVLADFTAGRTFLAERIAALGIDCDYQWTGFFFGAHTRRDHLAQQLRHEKAKVAGRVIGAVVPPSELASEVKTSLYHGGYLYFDGGQLHPARYHAGLRRAAVSAGAKLFSRLPVQAIIRDGAGFLVRFPGADIRARQVILATNGYTDQAATWIRRRLIPARSYMIATEPLAPGLAEALIPGGRPVADTKRILYYFRTSPDRQRILFGGRASFSDDGARTAATRLHGFMTNVFPELAKTKLSHAWYGNFALAFDWLPHVGVHEGVHYACGCNGSGVMMLSYLGHAAALRAMGQPGVIKGLDRVPFRTLPTYDGRPWFLPVVGNAYKIRDGWNRLTDRAA